MTEEGTALESEQQSETTTEAAPSLRETLQATYNELKTEDETTEEEADATEGADEITDETEEDVSSGERDDAEEEAEEGDEEQTTPFTDELVEGRSTFWNDTEKEALDALAKTNPEAAEALSKRYNDMLKGWNSNGRELAEMKKSSESINSLFKGRENSMQRQGLTQEGVVQTLLAWDEYMTKDPEAALQALAKQNNIDLTDLTYGGNVEDSYEDPAVKELKAEIQELKAKNSNDDAQRATANHQQLIQSAETFATETDKDGNLVHPYCEDVTKEMAEHIMSGKTLQEAYELSVWTNPQVRAKLMKGQVPSKPVESVDAKKARIAKAKKAGKSISSSSGKKSAVKPKESLSLSDDLRRTYAALSN